MTKGVKLFVVVPNLNGEKHLRSCLKSIYNQKIDNLKVVIVDNNSIDKSVNLIKEEFSQALVIQCKENLGYAGGANKGIRVSLKEGADYVLILNNDTILNKNLLLIFSEYIKRHPEVGILGPKIYFFRSPKKIWFSGGIIDKKRFTAGHSVYKEIDHNDDKQPKNVDFITGCAMLIKRDVFKKIGLFNEQYFIYYEDADFCIRAKRAGYDVVLVPQAILYHNLTENRRKSEFMDYLLARNHFLFVEKNAPLNVKVRELLRFPKTIYEHFRTKDKSSLLGIRDYFLRRFGYHDYWN